MRWSGRSQVSPSARCSSSVTTTTPRAIGGRWPTDATPHSSRVPIEMCTGRDNILPPKIGGCGCPRSWDSSVRSPVLRKDILRRIYVTKCIHNPATRRELIVASVRCVTYSDCDHSISRPGRRSSVRRNCGFECRIAAAGDSSGSASRI